MQAIRAKGNESAADRAGGNLDMTMKVPPPSMGDKILKGLGKKRGIIIPSEGYEKYGPYVYQEARKESFLKALLRSKDAPLPNNVIDPDELPK
jgi:hypothetical protein